MKDEHKKADVLEEMLARCQQGDRSAFTWLLEQYGQRVYWFYVRLSGSTQEAEDLLQDLFVRLIEKIERYKHDGRFESWLFRVAANLARDHARKRSRMTVFQSSGEDDFDFEDTLIAETGDPVETVIGSEMADKLQVALKKLSQNEREMVIMRHYGQLSFKEIAEHFNVPLGTALAKVHRALKKLRGMIEDET